MTDRTEEAPYARLYMIPFDEATLTPDRAMLWFTSDECDAWLDLARVGYQLDKDRKSLIDPEEALALDLLLSDIRTMTRAAVYAWSQRSEVPIAHYETDHPEYGEATKCIARIIAGRDIFDDQGCNSDTPANWAFNRLSKELRRRLCNEASDEGDGASEAEEPTLAARRLERSPGPSGLWCEAYDDGSVAVCCHPIVDAAEARWLHDALGELLSEQSEGDEEPEDVGGLDLVPLPRLELGAVLEDIINVALIAIAAAQSRVTHDLLHHLANDVWVLGQAAECLHRGERPLAQPTAHLERRGRLVKAIATADGHTLDDWAVVDLGYLFREDKPEAGEGAEA